MTAARTLAMEFLVIVLGVLTALGVDEWRQARAEEEREAHYLGRLIEDLVQDSATMATAVQAGDVKSAGLDGTIANLSDPEAIRREPSLAWPNLGYTYARPELQTTTFDELTSSGGLALIKDPEVRARIGRHYLGAVHQFDRLDDRRTRLAWKVADLFPGTSWGSSPTPADQEVDAQFFDAPNVEARMQALLGPEYQGLLNQERIYARSMNEISSGILRMTLGTLAILRAYAYQGGHAPTS